MELIYFCLDRKVMFCVSCKTGINPDQVNRHLMDMHRDIGKELRDRIGETKYPDAIQPTDRDGTRKAEAFGYTPFLNDVDGYACPDPKCHWLATTTSSWKAHVAEAHKDEPIKPQAKETTLQSMFPKPKHYFAVQRPARGKLEKGAATSRISGRLDEYTRSTRDAALRVPWNLNLQQLTKWDEKNQWAKFHEGRLMKEIALRSGFRRPLDLPCIGLAVEAMERLLHQWYSSLQELPDHVRRIFHSVGDGTLNGKPFTKIEESSFRRYVRVWQCLIAFLLRSVDLEDPQGLLLDDEQQRLLRRIKLPGSDATMEALDDNLTKLCVALVNQRVTRSPFQSPIVYWLSVDGYHVQHQRWKTATEARATLSPLVYCIRLASIAEWRRIRPEMGTDSARLYATKYLHDGSDTMFTTLHSLRAYAKAAGTDHYGNPSITWAPDGSSLAYHGDWLELNRFRGGFLTLVSNLEQLMLGGLVYADDGYLESRSPVHFKDDPMWSARGECFVNLQGTSSQGTWTETIERAAKTLLGGLLVEELEAAAAGTSCSSSTWTS